MSNEHLQHVACHSIFVPGKLNWRMSLCTSINKPTNLGVFMETPLKAAWTTDTMWSSLACGLLDCIRDSLGERGMRWKMNSDCQVSLVVQISPPAMMFTFNWETLRGERKWWLHPWPVTRVEPVQSHCCGWSPGKFCFIDLQEAKDGPGGKGRTVSCSCSDSQAPNMDT